MSEVVINVSVYHRRVLTGACLSYLLRQIDRIGLDAQLCVVDSERSCADVVPERAYYFNHENRPLSQKAQYSVKKCADIAPEAIGIVQMGSDDFLSDRQLMDGVLTLREGLTAQWNFLYVWDVRKGSARAVQKFTPFGAGRVITFRDLEQIGWRLYTDERENGLDNHSVGNLERGGVEFYVIPNRPGGIILDVKAGFDITDPDKYGGTEVDIEDVLRHLDSPARMRLRNLQTE